MPWQLAAPEFEPLDAAPVRPPEELPHPATASTARIVDLDLVITQ
jgi:hypothetical protein